MTTSSHDSLSPSVCKMVNEGDDQYVFWTLWIWICVSFTPITPSHAASELAEKMNCAFAGRDQDVREVRQPVNVPSRSPSPPTC